MFLNIYSIYYLCYYVVLWGSLLCNCLCGGFLSQDFPRQEYAKNFRILILYRRIMLYWYSKNIYLRNIFINLFLCLFYRCFDAPLGCFALHLHAFCLFYTYFSCFSCFPGFPGFPGFPLYFFIF